MATSGFLALARSIAACRDGEVVVFGQNLIEESEAMIDPAAGDDGRALEFAESGGCLARVEDDRFGSRHRIDKVAGEGGNAGKLLQEIQCGAFRGEQGAGWSAGGKDDLAGS